MTKTTMPKGRIARPDQGRASSPGYFSLAHRGATVRSRVHRPPPLRTASGPRCGDKRPIRTRAITRQFRSRRRRVGYGFERENVPALHALFDVNGRDRAADESRDGPFPKRKRGAVRFHDTNLPQPGKPPPYGVGDLRSNSTPTVSTHDEELNHIPNPFVAGHLRLAF